MTTHARTTPPNTELDLPDLPKSFEWRIDTWSHYNADTGTTIYRARVQLWHRGLFGWKFMDSRIVDPYNKTEREDIEYAARLIANNQGFAPTTPVPEIIAQYVGTYARKEN